MKLALPVVLALAAQALAGAHNYINLYSDASCKDGYSEVGLFENGQCANSTAPGALSVETVLLATFCDAKSRHGPPWF